MARTYAVHWPGTPVQLTHKPGDLRSYSRVGCARVGRLGELSVTRLAVKNGSSTEGGGETGREFRDRPKILLVDDDHLTLRAMEKSLRQASFQVWTSRRMASARMLHAENRFDAAMIDLRLEDGRGTDLVRDLRNAPVPCCAVIITGLRPTEAAREAMSAGAEEMLTKPVEVERLVVALRHSVERTRAWRRQLFLPGADLSAEPPTGLGAILDARAAVRPLPEPSPDVEVIRGDKSKLVGFPALPTLKLLDAEKTAEALVRLACLTESERRILAPLLRGETNGEIAAEVGISERTVKFHVSNILRKLRVSTRGDLVRFFF